MKGTINYMYKNCHISIYEKIKCFIIEIKEVGRQKKELYCYSTLPEAMAKAQQEIDFTNGGI